MHEMIDGYTTDLGYSVAIGKTGLARREDHACSLRGERVESSRGGFRVADRVHPRVCSPVQPDRSPDKKPAREAYLNGRRWVQCAVALIGIVVAGPVWAACSFKANHSLQNAVLSFPDKITVSRNAGIGTVLASASEQVADDGTFASCTDPGNVSYLFHGGASVSTPSGTVATNVPGIGVRFYLRANPGKSYRFQASGIAGASTGDWSWNRDGTGFWGADLVVTGDVTGGKVDTAVTADVTLDGLRVTSITLAGPITINALACTTSDATVSMGSQKLSAFKGIGSTTPGVAFNVKVDACSKGLQSIQYQFIPLGAVLDAANGVLALSSDSTAAGIGLQLKDGGGNALKYNKQYTLTNYNSSKGGSYTIPLTASYYETSSKVTAGKANAVLTFTMIYQ